VDAADFDAQAGLARAVGEAFGGLDAVFIDAGGRGIRVNAVSPGPASTPSEIAKAAVFLASDESPFAVAASRSSTAARALRS
jgi:hypothetical protein